MESQQHVVGIRVGPKDNGVLAGLNGRASLVSSAPAEQREGFPVDLASLLPGVGPEPVARLSRTARQRTLWAGIVVVSEEQTDRAGVLIDGLLSTVVSLPDGRTAAVHYAKPIALFGLPTLFRPACISVRVIRTATVIELDAGEIRRCAREYPDFGSFLYRQLAAEVCRLPLVVEEFGFMTVRQRVASHLIKLAESRGANTGVRTACVTQTALAEYVGSAREVVSRCLKELGEAGIVARGHGSLQILNEAKLRRLANQRGGSSIGL